MSSSRQEDLHLLLLRIRHYVCVGVLGSSGRTATELGSHLNLASPFYFNPNVYS